MKNLLKPFTVLSFLVLAIACTMNDKIPVITPANINGEHLTLPDIAEEVSYIKLDNSRLLSNIRDVKKTAAGYFVRTNDGVFLFGPKGEFIHQIGKKGKGPHEYTWVADFALDESSGLIYLLDGKKVLVYTYSGELKTTFSTPGETSARKIIFYHNHLYFPKGFGLQELKTEWRETDSNGNSIREKTNFISAINLQVEYYPNFMFEDNNSLYYWNQLNDTIFEVGENPKPAYLFANDEYRLTANDLASTDNFQKKSSWPTLSVKGTKHFLVFEYLLLKDKKLVYTIYDINKQKMYEWQVLENFEPKGINKFDNGPVFIPRATIGLNDKEYMADWIDAYYLKSIVATDEFKNSTPLYPEKKKELELLANSLDENDNPVLMLVKLK